MQITNISILPKTDCGKLVGIAHVTFDNELAVHDIKIIKTNDKIFVGMPSKRNNQGVFQDYIHPINTTFRQYLSDAILDKYEMVTLESHC